MALDTYANLQTALASWTRRSDLTTPIIDAITLTESQVNRRLRTLDMTLRATATISAEFSETPGDFQGVRSFDMSGGEALVYAPPDQISEWVASYNAPMGKPTNFTVVGGEFRFYPAPADSYTAELTYWQAVPALSDTNTSNWLLEKHPDVYLYGALMQLQVYLKNDERLANISTLYKTAMDDIETSNRTTEAGPYLTLAPSLVV